MAVGKKMTTHCQDKEQEERAQGGKKRAGPAAKARRQNEKLRPRRGKKDAQKPRKEQRPTAGPHHLGASERVKSRRH